MYYEIENIWLKKEKKFNLCENYFNEKYVAEDDSRRKKCEKMWLKHDLNIKVKLIS